MFYDDFCDTDIRRRVFSKLVELSKDGRYVAIQELDSLGYDRKSVEDVIRYFDEKELFREVRSRSNDSVPVIFLLK